MKRNIFILILLIIISTEKIMATNLKDKLDNFKTDLPASWNYEINNDILKFFSTDEIYILQENKINAPMQIYQKSNENAERIKKFGKKERPYLSFKIINYSDIKNLLKFRSKQAFYFDNKIIAFEEEKGTEDEFHSVYPYETYEQIYKIKNLMKKHFINILFDSAMELAGYIERQVLIIGSFSDMPWQHMIMTDKIYKYPEYFDIDKTQIVAYFKESPKKNKKLIALIGRIIEVKGSSKKPGVETEYGEYAILADEILLGHL